MQRPIPFTIETVNTIRSKDPTPFYVYDEAGIRQKAKEFSRAFAWVPKNKTTGAGFKNFYAVKALPNPAILKLVRSEGMGFDCSSIAELLLCERIGARGEEIIFTSNNTKAEEYIKAVELGAIINLDDITHLEYLKKHAGIPELLCFRYNPGPLKEGNAIIGKPEEAKYGLTREQIHEAYAKARVLGVKRFGLHTMVASNELDPEYFVETAMMLFDLAVELKEKLGIEIEFINLGGGIGIPYRPGQVAVDLERVSKGIRKHFEALMVPAGLGQVQIVTENGRVVTGPYGYLVTEAIHEKHIYKEYIGVDACMANLMRPGMYGAYHHITVMGKENAPADQVYDVTGSLCENNDKFAIDRKLPKIDRGDILVIHDGGAHGHAMGFNYNGKLRCAEFLLNLDGSTTKIRRAETMADHFATLEGF